MHSWDSARLVGAVDGTWTHMNFRSLPPQSSASAIPPRPHIWLLVLRDGIEPPTRGFSVPCSTDWATWANMATSIGFEPTIFAVTGRHVKPLHHEAIHISEPLSFRQKVFYHRVTSLASLFFTFFYFILFFQKKSPVEWQGIYIHCYFA